MMQFNEMFRKKHISHCEKGFFFLIWGKVASYIFIRRSNASLSHQ